MSEAPELSADEKARVARFVIHDSGVRVKVWCMNWTHPDAPHATVHIMRDGILSVPADFTTWEQAMVWADRLAGTIREAAAARSRISGHPANSNGLASPFPGGVA